MGLVMVVLCRHYLASPGFRRGSLDPGWCKQIKATHLPRVVSISNSVYSSYTGLLHSRFLPIPKQLLAALLVSLAVPSGSGIWWNLGRMEWSKQSCSRSKSP